jgi:hypothetical protein
VRRYGVYAGKIRKQWQDRPGIYRLAPVSWKVTHPVQSQTRQVAPPVDVPSTEAPDAWSKLRSQSWARLLQKVYEVDPFVCPKCQGKMSVVAIIENPKELSKIIDWAREQEKEQQLTVCARSPPELSLVTSIRPKIEAYAQAGYHPKIPGMWLIGEAVFSGFVELSKNKC